jgi:glutaredoxin 3
MSLNRRYIAALILAALLVLTPLAAHAEEWKGTVASNGAVAYSRMDTNSPVLWHLPLGTHVVVNWVKAMSDGRWCGLKSPDGYGTSGYVKCGYLAMGHKSRKEIESMPSSNPDGKVTVLLYMRNSCPYCRKALALLRRMDVDLVVYHTDRDPAKRREMRDKGGRGVPFIDIDGIYIRGYSEEAIRSAVKRKQGRR